MREQRQREPLRLRDLPTIGIMALGFLLPFLPALIVFESTPPEWGAVVSIGTLLMIGLIFLLLWNLPLTGIFASLQHPMMMSLLMVTVIATGFLAGDLAATTYDPLHPLQDYHAGLWFGMVNGFFLFIPFTLLQARRGRQRQIEIMGRYSATEALVARAFARATDGWGLLPQEARRKGRRKIIQGAIFGGFWILEGLGLLIGLTFLPLRPLDRLYLVLAFLIACGGVCLLVAFCRPGVRLLRHWKHLREQPQETIKLEGVVEEIWMQDAAPPSSPGNISVIKLNLSDGSSTFLLATSQAFPKDMLKDMQEEKEQREKEEGEEKEQEKMLVSIDYLADAEAVVRVTVLAPPPQEASPAEEQKPPRETSGR